MKCNEGIRAGQCVIRRGRDRRLNLINKYTKRRRKRRK